MKLRVGARGSDLSLAQTRWVIGELVRANAGLEVELVTIETHGDRDQTSSLMDFGVAGGFVKDIERALLEERIDLAVHSLKDVPTEAAPGLRLAAIPVRARAHDALLTRAPVSLDALPKGFTVGSSSPRRTHQLAHHAPQVRCLPLRGNVPTRLRKLREGQFDAIVLAAAGLVRLGLRHEHMLELDATRFPPAPGQGALALQTRESGPAGAIAASIDHAESREAVTAERAFLKATGGGCHAAAGAYARVSGDSIEIFGQAFVAGEARSLRLSGPRSRGQRLGEELAAKLLKGSTLT